MYAKIKNNPIRNLLKVLENLRSVILWQEEKSLSTNPPIRIMLSKQSPDVSGRIFKLIGKARKVRRNFWNGRLNRRKNSSVKSTKHSPLQLKKWDVTIIGGIPDFFILAHYTFAGVMQQAALG